MGSLIRKNVRLLFFLMAAIGIIVGLIFIWQGAATYFRIVALAQTEKVATGIPEAEAKQGDVVDNMNEMMAAGDVIRSHRQAMAQTYGELLGSGRFDPANPKHLSYGQAINLENYLYLGVISFGVSILMVGIGAFMWLVSAGFLILGVVLKAS